jgi:hypothetical protein
MKVFSFISAIMLLAVSVSAAPATADDQHHHKHKSHDACHKDCGRAKSDCLRNGNSDRHCEHLLSMLILMSGIIYNANKSIELCIRECK